MAGYAILDGFDLGVDILQRSFWDVAFCLSSATATFLFGATLFPNLIVSNIDPKYSLTVGSASSPGPTLRLMLVIAALGLPFVLAYTATIYRVFRGKVLLGKFSY